MRGIWRVAGRPRRTLLAALALSLLPLPGRAQTPSGSSGGDTIVVLPGDPRLEPERLRPHRATWRVTICDTDACDTVQGLWTDIWTRSRGEDDRPVIEFRQLFVDTLGQVLWDAETVFDAGTLRGLRSTQEAPPGGSRVAYRFAGDTATGTLRGGAGAEPRSFTVEFREPFWEPLAPVSPAFPLEGLAPGTAIRYPIWDQSPSGRDVTWQTMRVDSMARLETPDGSTIDVWHHTMMTDATPGVVFRMLRTPEPPFGWWLRVERPGLTREWTLVDWQPFAPAP